MKKKKIICSALASAMLLTAAIPAAGAVSFADTSGHWAEASISRWSNYDVIVGSNGLFNPDAPITRGEMASIIANMLGLEETAANRFTDLNGGWYTTAMLKCNAAGILVGDDLGQMRPYDNITGQELAVMLCKAFNLSALPTYGYTTGMVSGEASQWAQGYVAALGSYGIAIGNDGGYFIPKTNATRAAVVAMFDRSVGTYINTPGTYTASGLTIINTTGTVTLKGTVGDIIVTPASDKIKLKLDDTRVTGTIDLQAEEVDLTADSADLNGNVIVRGKNSDIALDSKTDAGLIQLESTASGSSVTVAKNAEVDTIRTSAQKTSVSVSGKATDIDLLSGAASSTVNVKSGGTVNTVDSAADKVTISGSGTLKKAVISGDNNKIDTDDTKVTIEKGVSGTKVNGTSKKSGTSTSSSSSKDYDVVFYLNYGSNRKYTTKSVNSGDKVKAPGDPTREGYIFLGWYTDEDSAKSKYKYDFSDKVYDDIDLYAQWEKGYVVTFDYNDGSTSAKKVTVEKNSKVSEPSNPTRTGYTFDGWYTAQTGGTQHNFTATNISADTTLYAHWTKNSYTVTFVTNGGSDVSSQTVAHGGTISSVTTTKEGYTFGGWYTDEALTKPFDTASAVTGDVTLYAKWVAESTKYTVTYHYNNDTADKVDTVDEKTEISTPATPSKENYTFAGWFTDEACNNAATFPMTISANTDLYAKWTENDKVMITLNLNYEGSNNIVKTPYKSSETVTLDTPTREGYRFVGWYNAPENGTPVTTLTAEADKTLYAYWIQQFTVTLNANEGTLPTGVTSPLTVDANSSLDITPTRDGYKFSGWFKDGTENTQVTTITENVSVTAKWESEPSTEDTQP